MDMVCSRVGSFNFSFGLPLNHVREKETERKEGKKGREMKGGELRWRGGEKGREVKINILILTLYCFVFTCIYDSNV